MILKRFYDEKLAQASYLIGCDRTGESIVIDANRDTEQYQRAARSESVRITHVTETHIHADFISGSRELAARTGAKLFLSDEGDANWKYSFARDSGASLLRDGDSIIVGDVKVTAMHTPGHTPENLAFLITDTNVAGEPMGMVTGDFVFVGDVGRPDLLERAAKMGGTMNAAARTLYRSLDLLSTLPDWLQIWPGHGTGSACGKGMSAVPQSTLGYERRFSWAFLESDESIFVNHVLAGQPEPPRYFAEMKRINKEGPKILDGFKRPVRLPNSSLVQVVGGADALVIDLRPAERFAQGHVPGTVNIPLSKSFTTWAGSLVPYDRDFYLIANANPLGEAIHDLAMIGLDRIAGYYGTDSIDDYAGEGHPLGTIAQMTQAELADKLALSEVSVIDVRGRSEWEAGHIADAEHIPLGYLPDNMTRIPRNKPVVLHCQGGGRSSIAASLLAAKGITNVFNLRGGFGEWEKSGLPVNRELASPSSDLRNPATTAPIPGSVK